MGSIITLGLGQLEIDWGKNESFRNHSALFFPEDVRNAPYYYADEVVEYKPAFVRKLRSVARRLDMLGYTPESCREKYEEAARVHPDYYPEPPLTYDQFASAIAIIDVQERAVHEEPEYGAGQLKLVLAIMQAAGLTNANPEGEPLIPHDSTFFANLDVYITLRLLAENPANLDMDVIWRTEDILEGYYVERKAIYQGLSEQQRCLVVTEGSSDGAILQESLPLVLPDIRDFFHFVDMTDNYPFTGTGNVVKFCQGLARIRILNRVLVVLDNDTAGREAYLELYKLDLPNHLRVAQLPDHERCRSVKTLGDSGIAHEDINGKAVSVECFLDIWAGDPEPTVQWTNYIKAVDAYQGALIQKETYTRNFFKRAKRPTEYDLTGLRILWDHLVDTCTAARRHARR